jgi:hypothetical protein
MHRRQYTSARGTLACALAAVVVLAAPSASLASRAASSDDALRGAHATERYWSTYDIDNALPRPAQASSASADNGPSWTGAAALAALVALVSAAGGALVAHVARRPRRVRA